MERSVILAVCWWLLGGLEMDACSVISVMRLDGSWSHRYVGNMWVSSTISTVSFPLTAF